MVTDPACPYGDGICPRCHDSGIVGEDDEDCDCGIADYWAACEQIARRET